jgi:hypothetical protein
MDIDGPRATDDAANRVLGMLEARLEALEQIARDAVTLARALRALRTSRGFAGSLSSAAHATPRSSGPPR